MDDANSSGCHIVNVVVAVCSIAVATIVVEVLVEDVVGVVLVVVLVEDV